MKSVTISTPSCNSVIYCGEGAFYKRLPELKTKHLFIVTDSNVFKLYGASIKEWFGNAPVFVIPAGERSKNYKVLLKILQTMLDAKINRASTVVALGGGVVGDITGLAASLYMRGVHLVQIPTTLLSQVDSSVGGKTAVDFNGVKNVIGTFYQPEEVIVDPLFLKTLPRRELRCGLGEIIKYGALDATIYEKLIAHKNGLFGNLFLDDIVYDCICHKAKVVAEDEKDTNGARKTLNLGHTTGHAFELWYKRLSHGEFVLIGMYYEMFIAQKLGVCTGKYYSNLITLINKVVKRMPAYDDVEKAAAFAMFDKKNDSAAIISIIVPATEGQCREIKLPVHEYIEFITQCRDRIKEELC